MPNLPTPDAYNEAVQAPRAAFPDLALALGKVDCNGFGIPRALGGGFAITYRLINPNGRAYAVRCFHKEARNLQDRYRSIHSYLEKNRLSPFVEFEYQHNGIRVQGKSFPIVKMEWVSGATLGEYIERVHNQPQELDKLRGLFAALEQELAIGGIAHGDLQNGNVLVTNGRLRLVDYDGMYVRGMPVGAGTEVGHKHFQHPQRASAHFGPDMDRFAFIVLDLSFQALRHNPTLFRQFSTGENVLFAANDFADPDSSQLFSALQQTGDTSFRQGVADLACVCKADILSVPRLNDFLARRGIPKASPQSITVPAGRGEYIGALPVLDAASFDAACRRVGDRVELVGRVVEVKCDSTKRGSPYVFINFGHWRRDCVRLTIWSEGLKALGYTPDASWAGSWVVANGMVDPVYHGKNRYKTITYRTVGITVEDPSQIHRVSEAEAMWRLGKGLKPGASPATPRPASVATANAKVKEHLQTGEGPAVAKHPVRSSPFAPPARQGPAKTIPQGNLESKNQQILDAIQKGGDAASTTSQSPSGSGQKGNSPYGCATMVAMAFALVILLFLGLH